MFGGDAMRVFRMIRLVLFLLLLVGCASQPSLDELVRDCQNRGGAPNVRGDLLGEFKCEMDQSKPKVE